MSDTPLPMPKLGRSEAMLLASLLDGPRIVPCTWVSTRLTSLGLVTGETDDWGHSTLVTITDAGRAHPALSNET